MTSSPDTKRKYLLVVLAVILILAAVAVFITYSANAPLASESKDAGSTGKPVIVTSFRPITLLVTPVAGDYAEVIQILPPGAEPHEYEPTPNDAIALQKAKILFYDGPGMEPWVEKLAVSTNPGIIRAPFSASVPDSARAELKEAYPDFPDTEEDSHFWLSPQMAMYYVPTIAQKLSEADPANQSAYEKNAEAFMARLEKLDASYKTGLSHCETRTFITSHSFLNYQAAAYNLTALSITGLSPEAEPSIQQMAAILNKAKAGNVQGVIAETNEVEALSHSIASELSLPVYPYTTMEVLPPGKLTYGDNDYVTIMENNLQQMRQALKCQ